MKEKTTYQKLKRIAEIMTETDEDVQWEIKNTQPKELWVIAFAEGAKYVDEIYRAGLEKTIDREVKQWKQEKK